MGEFPYKEARIGKENEIEAWMGSFGGSEKINENFHMEHWNPLQLAASEGCLIGVQTLLKFGGHPDKVQQSLVLPTSSPLHIAARYGYKEIGEKLLEAGADINAADNYGFTALHFASVHGHMHMVKWLLENGADVRCQSKGKADSLDMAKAKNHTRVVKILDRAMKTKTDPSHVRLFEWLGKIGGAEYGDQFVDAGFDFDFIAKNGLNEEDLDCVGIPKNKMGLRKKLIKLYRVSEVAENEAEEKDDQSGSESEEESSNESEDSGSRHSSDNDSEET